jgi:hypothetical protein
VRLPVPQSRNLRATASGVPRVPTGPQSIEQYEVPLTAIRTDDG